MQHQPRLPAAALACNKGQTVLGGRDIGHQRNVDRLEIAGFERRNRVRRRQPLPTAQSARSGLKHLERGVLSDFQQLLIVDFTGTLEIFSCTRDIPGAATSLCMLNDETKVLAMW